MFRRVNRRRSCRVWTKIYCRDVVFYWTASRYSSIQSVAKWVWARCPILLKVTTVFSNIKGSMDDTVKLSGVLCGHMELLYVTYSTVTVAHSASSQDQIRHEVSLWRSKPMVSMNCTVKAIDCLRVLRYGELTAHGFAVSFIAVQLYHSHYYMMTSPADLYTTPASICVMSMINEGVQDLLSTMHHVLSDHWLHFLNKLTLRCTQR